MVLNQAQIPSLQKELPFRTSREACELVDVVFLESTFKDLNKSPVLGVKGEELKLPQIIET